jgi:UDP-N-acetylglucosamine acyltransferase
MKHPTAVIHPQAQLHPTVRVGPYAVIDEHVVIGPGCQIGPHVYITGCTVIGAGNEFHAGCVVGEAPQDLKYQSQPTGLRIGERNVIREHATIHRSNRPGDETVIGSNNFLMAHSHVGHNSRIGSHVIVANGALIGGHVVVEDRAFISGNCLIHQFARVGTLALMQGGSGISRDLPPFTVARGDNRICGLNTIGLRRAGITADERLELRRLYQALFRSRLGWQERLRSASQEFLSDCSRLVIDFVAASSRGVCIDIGQARKSPELAADLKLA